MTTIRVSKSAIRRSVMTGIAWHTVWFSPLIVLGAWSTYLGAPAGRWILGIPLLIYSLPLPRRLAALGVDEIIYEVEYGLLTIRQFGNRIQSELKLSFRNIERIQFSMTRLCPQMIVREKKGILSKDTPIALFGTTSADRKQIQQALLTRRDGTSGEDDQ